MLKHGLDPADNFRPERLTTEELRSHREALGNFPDLVTPQLEQLFNLIGLSGCNVLLTDAAGIVVDQRVKASDVAQFQEWDLWEGADWSERVQGTNGIGTCLVEERQVVIHRNEHFRTRNIDLSCMDSPIWGPDGRLLAVLDVTSARAEQSECYNRLILSQVAHTAKLIEMGFFRASYPKARIVWASRNSPDPAMLLAVNKDDLVVGATRTARRALNLAREGEIDERPLAELLGDSDHSSDYDFGAAERMVLTRALIRTGGNVTEAARLLGIGRTTMYRRMARTGIGEKEED